MNIEVMERLAPSARTLDGKVALVTGSTSGIGLGVARALAHSGASVVLNGFAASEAVAAEVATIENDFGVSAIHHGADMAKPGEIANLIGKTLDAFGRLDILVNNAGIQHVAKLEEFPVEKWDAILAINLSSAFHTTRLALPIMRRNGYGRIVNIASAHALVGSPFKAAYVAAKHGLLGLTKVTALETAEDRNHLQRHLPRLRVHAACRGADRRPGQDARDSARSGHPRHPPRATAEQALRLGRGDRRTRRVPRQRGGGFDHRGRAARRWRMDGSLKRNGGAIDRRETMEGSWISSEKLKSKFGQIVLVFQGGGALGAYQAGVYEALHEKGIEPDWVIGTSIGAINASIIAGNKPADRLPSCASSGAASNIRRRSSRFRCCPGSALPCRTGIRSPAGVAGFFRPNPIAFLGWHVPLAPDGAGYYSTMPLQETLSELVDFSLLSKSAPRLTVGAARVRTSEMRYFDSRNMPLTVRHVMASGALPPAFPPIRIEGDLYWDGGILSNTPVEAIFDDSPRRNSLVFAVHVWNSEGEEPESVWQVMHRQKDVQYSSRAITTSRGRSRSTVCATSSPSSPSAFPRRSGKATRCAKWRIMAA